jgi:hypothetical protein
VSKQDADSQAGDNKCSDTLFHSIVYKVSFAQN